jgi:uncharacterized protein (TIGR00251 family)
MSSDPAGWLREVADGALLRVRVNPGASRPGVVGLHGDALRVRVAAPPAGGAANRALVRLLADVLGVRVHDVTIEAGAGARDKRVRVHGLTPAQVRARLVAALSVDTPEGHD